MRYNLTSVDDTTIIYVCLTNETRRFVFYWLVLCIVTNDNSRLTDLFYARWADRIVTNEATPVSEMNNI